MKFVRHVHMHVDFALFCVLNTLNPYIWNKNFVNQTSNTVSDN